MTAPESTAGLGIWTADDCPVVVEYSFGLLEKIRRQAVEGFNAFGHGGLEIGGVLYGTREGGNVRITASAELKCDHARGPGFVLSEDDQAAFAKMRKAPAGLEAVGWYCSHTRSGLALTRNDEVLFDSYFPLPGRVALVLQPTHGGPARAVFCFRDNAGELQTPPPRCQFTIEPAASGPAISELPKSEPQAEASKPPARREPEPQMVIVPAPGANGPEPDVPRDHPQPPLPVVHFPGRMPEKRKRVVDVPARRRWWWAGAAGLAAAMALLFLYRPATGRLGLQAYSVAPGQLRIEWNRRAAPVADARSGVLEIQDGPSHVKLPLSAEQLRSSSITYARQSPGDVLVRLRVEKRVTGDPAAEESIRYLAGAGSEGRSKVPSPEPRPPVEAAEAHRPVPAPAQPSAPSAERLDSEAPRLLPSAASEDEPARAEPVRKPSLFVPPPVTSAPVESVAVPPPPMLASTAAAPLKALPMSSPAPVPAPPVVHAGSRSGRIIWTGSLGRRGVVEIEGAHASAGSLTGHLPGGVPLTFHVSPAEFNRGGLVVYTSDATKNGRREPAGVGNGWNATTFEWNPDRAQQIAVLEGPNPTNDFGRLVVRNEARSCSVLVIEWNTR